MVQDQDKTVGQTRTQVEIFGQTYTIRSSTSGKHVMKLALYVDAKMREISSSSLLLSASKIGILAALDIADELFTLREEKARLEKELEQKTSDLVRAIDEHVVSNNIVT